MEMLFQGFFQQISTSEGYRSTVNNGRFRLYGEDLYVYSSLDASIGRGWPCAVTKRVLSACSSELAVCFLNLQLRLVYGMLAG